MVIGKWAPVERNEKIRATALRDRSKYGPTYEPVIYIEAEGGSSGRDAWLDVVRALEGFNVREDRPTGSKDIRAQPWSSMLAAGNVKLVDNGESEGLGRASWDINYFVTEHCKFQIDITVRRLGRWKDVVDSASAGFSLLANMRPTGGLRTYALGKHKKKSLKIIVCSRQDLPEQVIEDQRSLLLCLRDPEENTLQEAPPHSLVKLLAWREIQFADLEPKEYLPVWDKEIQPYNKKPEEVIMNKDHGKKVWAFLFKKRESHFEVIVIQDSGGEDKRGISLACAICDALGFKREKTIFVHSKPEMLEFKPDNKHVYEMTKASRHTVVE